MGWNAMRKLLFLAALLVLSATCSCHLGAEAEPEDHFSLMGDSAWLDFDSLTVVRSDSAGDIQDTLFHGPLNSLDDLKEMPAGKYDGGKACFVLRGYEGDEAVFEQNRCLERGDGPVVVDTLRDPDALPSSLTIEPDSLDLNLGDEPAMVDAAVKPAYADQGLAWTAADTSIVGLETVSGKSGVQVRPRKAGRTVLIARSRKDTSLSAEVQVRVRQPQVESVELDRDSLVLYLNGGADSLRAMVEPESADPAVTWSSGDTAVVKVDSQGRLLPGGEGRAVVRAKSRDGQASDSAHVTVKRDIPRLLVSTEGNTAIHSTLIFSARAAQEHGGIVSYRWDLDGDGNWDDSLSGPSEGGMPWSGDSVDLPAVSRKYDREGEYTARFRVRDTEGNEAETEVDVSISNRAPEILSLRADTTISIKDSVPMVAKARDQDGRLALLAWDYEGDGEYDDSLAVSEEETESRAGKRYAETGTYQAAFRAVDDAGKETVQSFTVRVELDRPVADAGRDTTMGISTTLQVSAKGTDGFGAIAKRELKVGEGGYIALSRQDTTIQVPAEPGSLVLVVRVTDDDGLSDEDTAVVTITRNVPRLQVSAEGNTTLHSTWIFKAKVVQDYGGIAMYAWDLDGNGSWDDSLSGPSDGGTSWNGDSVDLPDVSLRYDREGEYTARFRVRDTEGNLAEAEVDVSISNQAPVILSLRADTTLSIKDSVPMVAKARDPEGRLALLAWDYEGDGEYDDSLAVTGAEAEFPSGNRYAEAGTYQAAFRAVDDAGKETVQSFTVRVELDRPVADAGRDTTVGVGTALQVSAKGTDGFGAIVKRELKIGEGGYIALSRQDTTIQVPAEPGSLVLVVRVTDDDGLSDEDTAVVTLVHRSNARLASLTLSAGSLEPAFDPDVLHYSASVGHADSMVSVVPIASDAAARISVNGQNVASGTASASARLDVEGNDRVFRIVVTGQDGRTQMEYDVSIYRAPSEDATLSALAAQSIQWKPAFSPSTFEYRDTVPYGRTTVSLVPTASHTGASITVEDSPVASGVASAALPLALGPNTLRVGVTAQDGTTRNTYTLRIERRTRLILETRLGTGTPSPLVSLDLLLGGGTAIAAPAQTGYHFTRWSAVEGTVRFGDSTRAATMASVLAGVGRARAQYDTNTYALRVGNDGNGTTNPSGRVVAKHFVPHPISASPATGFRFRRWVLASGSATFTDSTAASTTVRLTDSAVVGAEFARLNYTLTVEASACFQSSTSTSVEHGIPHTLNAVASCSVAACPNGSVILRFSRWSVTEGTATLSNAQSRTSSVTLSSGNATLRPVYNSFCE
jgi:hypothetical protein